MPPGKAPDNVTNLFPNCYLCQFLVDPIARISCGLEINSDEAAASASQNDAEDLPSTRDKEVVESAVPIVPPASRLGLSDCDPEVKLPAAGSRTQVAGEKRETTRALRDSIAPSVD